MNDAFIYDGVRSPRARARPDGALHELTPQELLTQLYRGLCNRTGLEPASVGEVILGCVTQQGEQAANIARSSLLYAGWPDHVPGLTVHRFCSSSIDALALAAIKVNAGVLRTLVAGGVEMMSRVPMLSDGARIFADQAFAQRCRTALMGSGADLIASREDVSREQADAVAFLSQQRAAAAREAGHFTSSLLPIATTSGTAVEDECIRPATTMERLAAMAPAFAELGAGGVDEFQLAHNPQLSEIRHIHTAGNSPAMADAACTVLIGHAGLAEELDAKPRARIASSITVAADPVQVLTGCVEATAGLLEKTGLSVDDIDLFEIHEAFAATSVLAKRRLGLGDDKLNVNGGCIALGHPMGATGAIMTLTLLDELERRNVQRGIVAAAGAAGSGSALLLERV
ncbi:MAG: acetyl-CoA C-acyltransferase [Pseudomonadota bacterium]